MNRPGLELILDTLHSIDTHPQPARADASLSQLATSIAVAEGWRPHRRDAADGWIVNTDGDPWILDEWIKVRCDLSDVEAERILDPDATTDQIRERLVVLAEGDELADVAFHSHREAVIKNQIRAADPLLDEDEVDELYEARQSRYDRFGRLTAAMAAPSTESED